LAWYGKIKLNTTKECIHQSKEMYYNTNKHKKLNPGLVISYYIQPGNGEGLFLLQRFRNLPLTFLLKTLNHVLAVPGVDPHGAC